MLNLLFPEEGGIGLEILSRLHKLYKDVTCLNTLYTPLGLDLQM